MAAKEKGSKAGRRKKKCELYKARNRRNINKAKKLMKYIKKKGNDLQAVEAARALFRKDPSLINILRPILKG